MGAAFCVLVLNVSCDNYFMLPILKRHLKKCLVYKISFFEFRKVPIKWDLMEKVNLEQNVPVQGKENTRTCYNVCLLTLTYSSRMRMTELTTLLS